MTNYQQKYREFQNATLEEKRSTLLVLLDGMKEGLSNLEVLHEDISSGAIFSEEAFLEIYNILLHSAYLSDNEVMSARISKFSEAQELQKKQRLRESIEREEEQGKNEASIQIL